MLLKKYMALFWVQSFLLMSPCASLAAQHAPLPDSKVHETNAHSDTTPATQAHVTPEVRGELWTGALYSSKYKAGACINAQGHVHGVLILQLKNGDEDVYHFSGTKDITGKLHLKHSSGHTFVGTFESATRIEGKVTTKNGFTVKLKGTREQNALLHGPTCRPL